MRRRWPVTVLVVLATNGALQPVHAQSNGAQRTSEARSDTADGSAGVRPERDLFGRRDLLLWGGLFAATALVMPLDRHITDGFQARGAQESRFLESTADVFNSIGQPGVAVFSLGTLALGHIIGSPMLSDVGLHASIAVVSTGLLTSGLKSVFGRQRPELNLDDSDEFRLGAGMGNNDRSSLPSGHTSVAFALATVLSHEVDRLHPGSAKWARPVFYGGATLVGLSRIYDARHWTSDVVLGAGIGTLIGLKVTQLAHRDEGPGPGFLQSMSVMPGAGGVRIGWTLPAR